MPFPLPFLPELSFETAGRKFGAPPQRSAFLQRWQSAGSSRRSARQGTRDADCAGWALCNVRCSPGRRVCSDYAPWEVAAAATTDGGREKAAGQRAFPRK
jgi:hypothetical protein